MLYLLDGGDESKDGIHSLKGVPKQKQKPTATEYAPMVSIFIPRDDITQDDG